MAGGDWRLGFGPELLERLERETSLRGNDCKCLPPGPRQEGKDNAPDRLKERASHPLAPGLTGFHYREVSGAGAAEQTAVLWQDTKWPLRRVGALGEQAGGGGARLL